MKLKNKQLLAVDKDVRTTDVAIIEEVESLGETLDKTIESLKALEGKVNKEVKIKVNGGEIGTLTGAPGKDGKDGKDGYSPKKGIDYMTQQEVFQIKKEVTPIKYRDYFDGKDGVDGKDGLDGVDGKDGRDGKDGKDGTSPEITTKFLVKEINKLDKEIDYGVLKNTPDIEAIVKKNIPKETRSTKLGSLRNGLIKVEHDATLTGDGTPSSPLSAVGGEGSGTVSDISVVTANGISGTVANSTTTPAITLALGEITPTNVTTGLYTLKKTGAVDLEIMYDTDNYPGFTNPYGGFFLGISGDPTTYINFYHGTGLAVGWTDNLQTVNVYGTLTTTGTIGGSNLSGTNTGDNATNSQYSGLAASKADVGQTFYIGTTQVAINRASAALTLAGITLTTPNIGTPSAGTLTSCTGLPIAGLVASTSTALGVGSIELGHASDTSITRVSAGVAAIEGKNIALNGTSEVHTVGTIELGNASDCTLSRGAAGTLAVEGVNLLSVSNTATVTNKRINPRLVTAASYTTDTGTSLDVSTCDQFEVTAQAGALKLNNPSGTPTGGQKLIVRIKDNGTARALTYDTQFRAMGNALPSTTVVSKTLYLGFIFNATDTKWDLIAVAQEA